ncbi:MAG: hypothetical protein M9933_16955 [Chitinophagaceae bacterium]|nr:hypothetical protein [Chitinophagaceae bacterium]
MDNLNNNLHALLRAPMDAGEEKIIKAEMTLAVNLAKLACKIGIERFRTPGREVSKIPDMRRKKLSKEFEELIQEHKRIWVLRNKPGGLHKSAEAMEKSRKALFLD